MRTLTWNDKITGLQGKMESVGLLPVKGCSSFTDSQCIQRFQVIGDKAGSKNGWVRMLSDGRGFAFGSWKLGEKHVYFFDDSSVGRWDPDRLSSINRFQKQIKHEKRIREKQAAEACLRQYQDSEPASEEHPYLQCKQIKPDGIQQVGPKLLIPLFDKYGNLMSTQTIARNRKGKWKKYFASGLPVSGGRFWYGDPTQSDTIFLCEGLATGASIYEANNSKAAIADNGEVAVGVCFSGCNLVTVAASVYTEFPDQRRVVCADNDVETEGNPGLRYGKQAQEACCGEMVKPVFPKMHNGTDFNDLAVEFNLEHVRAVIWRDLYGY